MTDKTMTKKNASTTFGRFLRQRREALGLTLQDVAKRMTNAGWKTSHPTVAHWESTTNPTIPREFFNPTFIHCLAQVLETTPAVILQTSGLLEGIDTVNSEDAVIAAMVSMLQKMSPDDRDVVYELMKRMRG
jgi:transcriptional regulator with XRE-family HTH domain